MKDRLLLSLLCVLLVASLSACQPRALPAVGGDELLRLPTPVSPMPVRIEPQLPGRTDTPEAGGAVQYERPIETVEHTPVALLSNSELEVEPVEPDETQPCSPLQDHPRAELPEIVSDPYQPPPAGKEDRHHGVDFAYYRRYGRDSISGAGVQSAFAGQVVAAIANRYPYGNMLIVETSLEDLPAGLAGQFKAGESLYTLYAHLESTPQPRLGERVSACQRLGAVGKSGNAGVAHLHLEMRRGPAGMQFPSMAYYSIDASDEERLNYERWRTGGEFQHFDPLPVLVGNISD
jgi:murein DD-endopeptidase MepM/ murein hydrolase activator NlpD